MLNDMAKQEQKQLEATKQTLVGILDNLPDNPAIHRVSKNAFTVSSSELFKRDSWSPRDHDFKYQYQVVINKLEASESLSSFQRFLERVISTGVIEATQSNERVKLQPEVVEELKRLL